MDQNKHSYYRRYIGKFAVAAHQTGVDAYTHAAHAHEPHSAPVQLPPDVPRTFSLQAYTQQDNEPTEVPPVVELVARTSKFILHLRRVREALGALRPVLTSSWLAMAVLAGIIIGVPAVGYTLTHFIHKPKPAPAVATVPKATIPTPTPIVTQPTPVPVTPAPAPKPAPAPVVIKPAPTPSPVPSPPSLPSVTGKDTGYNLGVLVIKYFPLTSNGQNIDINVTGDIGDPYQVIRQKTIDITNNLVNTFMPRATQYLGYKYGGNAPSISLHVVATFEHTTAVPINATIHPGYVTYPDYYGIMSSHNICSYVDGQGVHEVFLWAYQGPNQPSKNNQPYLGIEESKMSGPYGDISNSYRWNDMPHCQHTYVVYTFNYGRGTAEALHSWGHQNEAELAAVDSNLFGAWPAPESGATNGLFQGPMAAQALGLNARCGSVHNPPNSRQSYDYANPIPQMSDCEDWNPNGTGQLSPISCANWGCQDHGDTNNAQLNYLVWMWQHLPGRNNTKTYQGKQLRNWWDVHGAFDTVMGSSRRLTL